jgi:hypothetical protein
VAHLGGEVAQRLRGEVARLGEKMAQWLGRKVPKFRKRSGSMVAHLTAMEQSIRIQLLPSPRQLCQFLGRLPLGMAHDHGLAQRKQNPYHLHRIFLCLTKYTLGSSGSLISGQRQET